MIVIVNPSRRPFVAPRLRALSFGLSLIALATACSEAPIFIPDDDGSTTDLDGSGGQDNMGGSDGGIALDGAGGTSTGGTGPIDPEAVCGNGDLEVGELCDDGNEKGGDGCSADCTVVDPDFLCVYPGDKCQRIVTCGNGVVEGSEACDDGDEDGGDGCSANCDEVEEGFVCIKPGQDCVALSVCGNGTRERGEQCDDGQEEPADGDGCDATCQLEAGFFCPPGQACVELVCGDGNRTPDEACDDGDTSDGDGCSSECEVEEGFRCSSSGCAPICGDGLVRGTEECDDGDRDSFDGCSAACIEEPYQACSGEPSVCASTIACGNGVVEPGEVCDPLPADIPTTTCVLSGPNACKAFDNGLVDVADCGNGVIEFGEDCDGDGGTGGCSDVCEIEDGYVCLKADTCFKVAECGDSLVQAGEECDVGMMSSLACNLCLVQPGWFCTVNPDLSTTCVESVCGDGERAPDEQCEDGGTVPGDGCSGACEVESGWVCPPGAACQPVCGDGLLRGTEECDISDPGCVNCQVEPGYDCGPDGLTACAASVCGNGVTENGEGCDDGGRCSDDVSTACTSDDDCSGTCELVAGDGCGPTCQIEPSVAVGPNPIVATTCGDGMRTGAEQAANRCDDGNTDSGDGCDAACFVETGWQCTDQLSLPGAVNLKIKYRDFKGRFEDVDNNDDVQAGGHPQFGRYNVSPLGSGAIYPEMTGELCTPLNQGTCGRLDSQGKPVLEIAGVNNTPIPNDPLAATYFGLWYRANDGNYPSMGGSPVQWGGADIDIFDAGEFDFITLSQDLGADPTGSTYVFEDETFYPLDQRGHGDTGGEDDNFHFTSEMRYFFRYQRGQELQFYGDDDVWVYVNGRLAVDIGGIHGQENGRVVLGDEDASCDPEATTACALDPAETTDTVDDRFDIAVGNLYEIVVFQAERSPTESNYKLTLNDFISARSDCQTVCGDGVRAGNELCDDPLGNVDGVYGQCNTSCTYTFCGDGIPQPEEECDNGLNIDTYDDGSPDLCAPGCFAPPSCGDGLLQPIEGEQCDDGTANNDGSYGGCNANCTLAAFCGDGTEDTGAGEECDTPGEFVTYRDGSRICGFDCKLAPFCGDGERNGPEQCEPSLSPYCNASCTFDPYCGDGLWDMSTEQCDYGEFGTPIGEEVPFGGCDAMCELGPYCGDGDLHPFEECDEGTAGNTGEYDGCTASCALGPRCGDGIEHTAQGEQCDNGFNDDVYAYPGTTDACGQDCSDVPYCGDGDIQAAYELCDDGNANADDAYDGCTTSCDWGPYCGDGTKNGPEQCDNGPDNVAYSPDGEGCSYECTTDVPYCGDGIRNGPEQCDLGTEDNDGDYGGCNPDCTRAPYCGDKKVQKDFGEECDVGPAGDLGCYATCKVRDGVK